MITIRQNTILEATQEWFVLNNMPLRFLIDATENEIEVVLPLISTITPNVAFLEFEVIGNNQVYFVPNDGNKINFSNVDVFLEKEKCYKLSISNNINWALNAMPNSPLTSNIVMIPLDYGDIIAAGGDQNAQVYTTGEGEGIASVDILPFMSIGNDINVSDLANNCNTNNIQIDSGVGNTILFNGVENQDITLNTNGASVTIRRMTLNQFMVISKNF